MWRWPTRRQLRGGAAVLGLVVAFAALSLVVGDTLWAQDLPPVQQSALQTPAATQQAMEVPAATQLPGTSHTVWLPQSGARYHRTPTCSGMQSPREATVEQAIAEGFTPCKRCYPDP